GTADKGALDQQADGRVALGEAAGAAMVVLEAAVRQQRAAVVGVQPEALVEQEVAAVEADVLGAIHHPDAIDAVAAENAAEDVDGGEHRVLRPVREGRAIADVVAKVAVEDL